MKNGYNLVVVNYADVKNYYQSSQLLYSIFCYNSKTLGMHYGFWGKGVKTRQQSIENENEVVARTLGARKNMKILDLGCGVGGTAIYLAKKYGVKVVGITLDPNQVVQARINVQREKLDKQIEVREMNFMNLNFRKNSFDGVFGIESVCYAYPKTRLFKDVLNILKPNGKFVIADGYRLRNTKNKYEDQIVSDFCKGFVLPELPQANDVSKQLIEVGFNEVEYESMKDLIRPSVEHFGKLGNLVFPIASIFSWVEVSILQALYLNALALKMANEAYKLDLADYGIHLAVK